MSENIDGGLGFRATLDVDDFNVSADAMEAKIKDVSGTTVTETGEMDQAFMNFATNAARYITATLIGGGMMGLVNSIIQTRGQFQQLSIAFDTMLGSASKSKELMDQIVDTAAKTPFDLMGVASGAKQLLAYGESADKVNETLTRLGNIASGLSIPLNDIVYLYGTTMVQGRLYAQDVRQFTGRGIPLVRELAKMYGKTAEEINAMVSAGKIGFPDVEKVINKMTDSGGQFYNLMEKQSKSLSGMVSNLSDAWDTALNKIGTDNQKVLSEGISAASYAVQHMDTILTTIKAIAIGYGSYKAAIALNSLALKGNTGIALIDNTVRSAKIALLKADEAITGQATARTETMTAAQVAHTASLQAQLTVEEQSNLAKQLRISTIEQLLTAQQQEYLSNVGITTSSANYEKVAMSIMTVDQRASLAKTDLSSKSAIYQAALEKEVATKTANRTATLESMRADVKAAAAKLESARMSAIEAKNAVDAGNYEVYRAKQSGDAAAIATAEKKLEGAVDNEAITRKAALAANSDFYAKKKLLEATATKTSTVASEADVVAKTTQSATTSILTAITTKASLAMKALWASMITNPIGWIVGLIGAAVSIFTLFNSKSKEAKTIQGEFQDALNQSTEDLKVNMAVLQNTANGTETHRKALNKINDLCKEYNKTLLDENDSLDKQKSKYDELTKAIQSATAEKIKAKYVEQSMKELTDKQTKALEDLKNAAEHSTYDTGETTYVSTGYGGAIEQPIIEASTDIRNASQAVWDAVDQMAMDAANKLKSLTGNAYEQAFNESINKISKAVQTATGASDKEMESFNVNLRNHLTTLATASKDANANIQKVDNQLHLFYSTQPNDNVKSNIISTTMSFSDLEQKAKDTQKQIDAINSKKIKVQADYTQLNGLIVTLNQVNDTIDKKTHSLNTEAGINERIQKLKAERSEVVINGDQYKKYTKEIDELEAKLPKTQAKATKAAETAQNKAEQLAERRKALQEKETDAELKAEQSRISIMDDGYEKRKAQLDLQHKQTMAQIEKEQHDLEKARKQAGKGELTTKEKSYFGDQRVNEEKNYNKQVQKLFDGEIDYKKSQYELYWKWVKNMGADVANTQFAKLLQGGASFKDYLENEIKKLNDKKASGQTLSEGETNNLINLKVQYNDITGAKSAMDSFKESLSQAISNAKTLAEKLKVIADFKEKIQNGSSGLVGADEKAAGSLVVNQEEDKTNKEIQNKILTDFKTYQEKKDEIIQEYNLLRLQKQVQNNQDLLDKINQGESDALSTLNAQQLKESQSWKDLFQNLDVLSTSQIEKLIADIEKQTSKANLKLSPVDYKALTDSLNQAKDKVISLNPFKSLGSAFDTYISSTKKLKDAEKNNLSDDEIIKLKKSVKDSANQMAKSIASITEIVGSVGDSLSTLADSFGNDDLSSTVSNVTGVLSGAGQTAGGVAKIMSGDLVGGLMDVTKGVTSVITSFNKMHDAKYEKQIKKLQEEIDSLADSYDNLGDAIDKAYSTNKADLIEQQNENLEEQNELLQQQIEAEEKKKKTDNDKIKEWEDQIEENNKTIADNTKYAAVEAIMGTEISTAIDDFATAYADAWASGEKAATKSADVVKNLIKTAIIDQLKNKLQPEVTEFMTYMSKALSDGIISDSEQNMLDEYEKKLESISDNYLSQTGDWLTDDDDEDALTGAVTSMSEETGGIVAGRLNAVVINQSNEIGALKQILICNTKIANNTEYCKNLEAIATSLKNIEEKESSFLSKGIS